jgi:hypothetical protein
MDTRESIVPGRPAPLRRGDGAKHGLHARIATCLGEAPPRVHPKNFLRVCRVRDDPCALMAPATRMDVFDAVARRAATRRVIRALE